jgi:hypothetical protein
MPWNPDPSEKLHEGLEGDPVPLTLCYYTPPEEEEPPPEGEGDPPPEGPQTEPPLDHYRFELPDGAPDGLSVSVSAGGVAVSATDMLGSFDGLSIGYIMGDNTLGTVDSWSELPEDAVDVYNYSPPAVTEKDIRVRAIAVLGLGPDPEERVADYVITVRYDLDSGRDTLIAEIEKRRRGPR